MCGFAGYMNMSQQGFSVDKELLSRMHNTIAHRGPDGGAVWASNDHQLGLAFRRLSIIDLSDAAMQPMMDRDGTVILCFNGEIYNHHALRTTLIEKGFSFSSQSDTEVLLYAYKAWGIDFLSRLDGMFAITLYDLQTRRFYLIRDRIGVKPLYFSLQSGIISFASEIKALWELPWMQKSFSDVALYHYLTFMVSPAPYTIFQGVYKLPAGFYACIDEHKNISFTEWYNPVVLCSPQEKKEYNSEDYCVDAIRTSLFDAIEKRMGSDVPFGAFLSGGVDSSLNVALMSRFSSPIRTFSIAFDDACSNELEWARLIANNFSTDHHEIKIAEQQAFELYEKMVYHLDEPLADCVCIPFLALSQFAKKSGVSMVHVGEGADELFFGYQTYLRYKNVHENWWQTSQKIIPQNIKLLIAKSASFVTPQSHTRNEVLSRWGKKQHLFWGGALGFGELQKERMLLGVARKEVEHDDVVARIYPGLQQGYDSSFFVDYHLEQLKQRHPDADFCQQMLYLELKQRLPELLLMRVDKMSMAAGLEAREPFLDYKLIELMYNIPSALKVKNGTTKYLLKRVAQGLLPDITINRKKVGFAAPTVAWFKRGTHFPSYFNRITKRLAESNIVFGAAIASAGARCEQNTDIGAVQKWVIQNIGAMLT